MAEKSELTKSQIEAMKKAEIVQLYLDLQTQSQAQLQQAQDGLQEQITNLGNQVRDQGKQIVDLSQRLVQASTERDQALGQLQQIEDEMQAGAVVLDQLPGSLMGCRTLGELVAFMMIRYDQDQQVPRPALMMLNQFAGRLRPAPAAAVPPGNG